MANDYEYDVALSFAGEDRSYVERVAKCLRQQGIKVFYDHFEESTLWGKNLYTHLSTIYKDKANYTVIFISKHYAQKLWTNHERESAQARAFTENKEYILPARFDATEIPGILNTVGYIDLNKRSPESFGSLIYYKIKPEAQGKHEIESIKPEIQNLSHETKPKKNRLTKLIFFCSAVVILYLIWWILNFRHEGISESEAWNAAVLSDDSSSYATYCKKYPNGKFYDIAKAKIDSIKNPENKSSRNSQHYTDTTLKSINSKGNNVIKKNPRFEFSTICDQVWMKTNLSVVTYQNGDSIPEIKEKKKWMNLNSGAWCWYNNDSAKYAHKYGRLYNWYAVNDPRGLAPKGWHIPSSEEWETLYNCIGKEDIKGFALMSKLFGEYGDGATNTSGFSALSAGGRGEDGQFDGIGSTAFWWSSDRLEGDEATYCTLGLNAYTYISYHARKVFGSSVRCIKD